MFFAGEPPRISFSCGIPATILGHTVFGVTPDFILSSEAIPMDPTVSEIALAPSETSVSVAL